MESAPPPSPCFECLERRIIADLSQDVGHVEFIHGLSDTPLPFASSALTQISVENKERNPGSEELSGEFVISGLNFSSDQHLKINEYSSSRSEVEESQLPNNHKKTSIRNTISKLIPLPFMTQDSHSSGTIRDIISNYLNQSTENHVMSALIKLLEGESVEWYGINYLKFLRFHSFDGGTGTSGTIRHPNISPILCLIEKTNYHYLLEPKIPFTLDNILHFSPSALQSDWHVRFLIYQIISAISHMHELGFSHGNLNPKTIHLTDSLWAWVKISDSCVIKSISNFPENNFLENECLCGKTLSDFDQVNSSDWKSGFTKWWKGQMSNFDYLLLLNKLSGRRWGDPTFHTVMPWVVDFTQKPEKNSKLGWRDLTKSKWRLAKGDEQLDFTYQSSEIPHHVSDECLSELAVCSYKARRLSLSLLKNAVRQVYVPNEYPSSMARLYQWTPDESVPEFYMDSRVFVSVHEGMSDLAVPPWTGSREEFVSLHRGFLESEFVSKNLHEWIDLTFGYKMSGEDAVEAKNVILPRADVARPRSTGRKQLFRKPHPKRNFANKSLDYLKGLEEMVLFCENERHLDPVYNYSNEEFEFEDLVAVDTVPVSVPVPDFDFGTFMECFELSNEIVSNGYPEMLDWKVKSSNLGVFSQNCSEDISSIGCVIAEIYLHKPLFDPLSLEMYKENGVVPTLVQELPPHVKILVESCIERDWKMRPSAKSLLHSKYFTQTIRSVYTFLVPLQILCEPGLRIKYLAKLAKEGALKAMGSFAAEMCVAFCVPLILTTPLPEPAVTLLREFLNCLTGRAIKDSVLPVIQKILQVTEYSHLKVCILQESFIRDLWSKMGKQVYMDKIHPLVIANLCNSPNKQSSSAASVLLVGSCEELGLPVTIHQTILPLIQSFGKGISADGNGTLLRIGVLFGENFILKHLVPVLKAIIMYCTSPSQINRPEPVQIWNSLTLINCFSTLDGLTSVLSVKALLKELFQDQILVHAKVLTQIQLDLSVTQVALTTLITLCQRIGPELSCTYILPQLKELFAELAFNQSIVGPTSSQKDPELKLREFKIESRSELLFVLYPFLASFIGIEKLRQNCSTWFLLEQSLHKSDNWKWESFGEPSRSSRTDTTTKPQRGNFVIPPSSDPNKVLLNGSGWSKPQSQSKPTTIIPQPDPHQQNQPDPSASESAYSRPSWSWFPNLDSTLDLSINSNNNNNGLFQWRVKGAVLCSARAHPGAIRSFGVGDECAVFTAGVGPGFRGSVQKWDLGSVSCVSGYYGHDEVVNSICMLSTSNRTASCDGTIHVWNSGTGKLISAYAESGTGTGTAFRTDSDQPSILAANPLTGGVLSDSFNGGSYTCLCYVEAKSRLVAGMGNGSLRFIDIEREQKLHLFKSDSTENSIVSAICLSESSSSPSIAIGFSSGNCRVIDSRAGAIVASWKAHDGYITKLAALEDQMLISSSLDKTLRVWDIRRSLGSQLSLIEGHSDGVSSFAVWGKDVISISRNKISLTSLCTLTTNQQLVPQYLYSLDKGMRNLSPLSTIEVLRFSRLFLVGTEDGFLKICS
ncbi:hypothetical protein LUZ60_012073 [Juncus effusus]|nr:hypothetical protein LUZ60_012073 [Juncus effusus]